MMRLSFEDADVTNNVRTVTEPEQAFMNDILQRAKALGQLHRKFRIAVMVTEAEKQP